MAEGEASRPEPLDNNEEEEADGKEDDEQAETVRDDGID